MPPLHLAGTLLALTHPETSGALPAPTWTDKEVIITVGSALAAVVPIVVLVIRLATAWYRDRTRKAEAEALRLRKEIEALGKVPPADQALLTEVQKQLLEAEAKASRLEEDCADARNKVENERLLVTQLRGNLSAAEEKLTQHEAELAAECRRIHRALQKGGQTWTERVLSNAPDFRRLEPDGRRVPIISVLNLKGGVGKTTVVANLGAALDGRGHRALLLDLDLQGSLTNLFLPDARQAELAQAERLLEDFLPASFGAEHPNLLDYTQPVLPEGKSGLVPTTDALVYAETNLTVRWLLREGSRDPRFLLRKELQLRRVTNRYDVVLLDCPPVINVCCVNALAASDYLLIPVLPSRQATDRVPILLRRLREFREHINGELKVLGIVANRTHRSELTAEELSRLSLLRVQCKDILGQEVPLFETFIRQSAEVREAEDEHRPLGPGDGMHETFLELAREVESWLPTFCRPGSRAGNPAPSETAR